MALQPDQLCSLASASCSRERAPLLVLRNLGVPAARSPSTTSRAALLGRRGSCGPGLRLLSRAWAAFRSPPASMARRRTSTDWLILPGGKRGRGCNRYALAAARHASRRMGWFRTSPHVRPAEPLARSDISEVAERLRSSVGKQRILPGETYRTARLRYGADATGPRGLR